MPDDPRSSITRRRLSGRLLPLIVLAAAACVTDAPSGPTFQVRDSAGVTIAENGGDVWTYEAPERVSAEPVLRIGAVDGEPEYLFDRIRGAVVLADGRIVVANSGSNAIRWFDASGRFLFERGGTGDGPGEFRRLAGITLIPGDTIVATDSDADRVTLLSADGDLLSATRIGGLPGPEGSAYRLADGSFIVGTTGFSGLQLGGAELLGHHRLPTPIVRVQGDPPRVDTIGLFPGLEMYFRVDADGRRSYGPHQYGRGLHYAVHDDELYVGTAERFEVDVFSPDGRRVRSVRAPDVDLRLIAEDVVETPRQRVRAMPEYAAATAEERAEAEEYLSELERGMPATRPAFARLLVDADGRLWVSEHDPDAGLRRRWALFDRSGRLEGTVSLPERFTPLTVGSGLVLGRMQDELGVQYLVAYRLGR